MATEYELLEALKGRIEQLEIFERKTNARLHGFDEQIETQKVLIANETECRESDINQLEDKANKTDDFLNKAISRKSKEFREMAQDVAAIERDVIAVKDNFDRFQTFLQDIDRRVTIIEDMLKRTEQPLEDTKNEYTFIIKFATDI